MEVINPEKLLLKIVAILEEVNIPYFITGGFAVSVWGRPRATFDLDIVVELIEPKVEPLAKTLRKIYKAGYIDENVAKDAIRHSGEFNFIDPLTGVKVDFWVAKRDELSLLNKRYLEKWTKKLGVGDILNKISKK